VVQNNIINLMKNTHIKQKYIFILTLLASTLVAQTSQPVEKKNTQEKKEVSAVKDLNANGIDDTKENQESVKSKVNRMHDRFIDVNGDGICDTREQGLGFRRGKGQSTTQTGKRQQGRQK
jgi:Na+-transporting NADH:ubiquinone oxidoreductase subunit NqrC